MSVGIYCQKCGYHGEIGPFLCRLADNCGLAHVRRVLAQPKVFDAKPSSETPSDRRVVDKDMIITGPPS
jgi:hypothetical protein